MNFLTKWFGEGDKVHHKDPEGESSKQEEEGPTEEKFPDAGAKWEEGAETGTEEEGREEPEDKKSRADEAHHRHRAGAGTQPIELQYLERLIRYRLAMEFHAPVTVTEPAMPPYREWDLPLGSFILDFPNENPENLGPDEAKLLLISLVHHVLPDLFDQTIDSQLKGAGDFPKIGGTRGKNFRGFMPTGETALFLLAGDDWKKRLAIQRLFWADHVFARKKILWLEEIVPGEPAMSGKITLSPDYVDLFTQNRTIPPHFGMSFPARLVTTDRTREDLVVNPQLDAQINDLLDWVKYHKKFANQGEQEGGGKVGCRSLFYGPSGTGKTFAARILGKETEKAVYRVDLSMVVSKYIGETEKNLEMLFARAENKKWILFFDEADSLFGKRTNVRDAHDKYANQEVSYLLQRIEDYDGLVILATNMKNNIDEAFIRRFDSILKFPMPDAEERKKIWQKTFPRKARFAEKLPGREESAVTADEEEPFDIAEVVKKYELSGGNIANAVHYAGIKATKRQQERKAQLHKDIRKTGEPDEPLTIYLPDVIDAIRHELSKSSIPFNYKN